MHELHRYDPPLLAGTLLRRYKRFLADVQLADGTVITAHCPDPGAMGDLAAPGREVRLSSSDNPRRKLAHTWEMVLVDGTWVSIHTGRTNGFVAEALAANALTELPADAEVQREVRVAASRLDFRLDRPGAASTFLEVKTVTLRDGDIARFPDSVTARGRKHLGTLTDLVTEGQPAALLFFVARDDCREFRPADAIDPDYGTALRAAAEAGVQLLAYRAEVSPQQVRLAGSITIIL